MTDEMLKVARTNAPIVAERIGYNNVEFRKGRIQDLALDLEKLDEELKARPITDAASFLRADELAQELRVKHPLVADDSVDVVVSNCVLNLVEPKVEAAILRGNFPRPAKRADVPSFPISSRTKRCRSTCRMIPNFGAAAFPAR